MHTIEPVHCLSHQMRILSENGKFGNLFNSDSLKYGCVFDLFFFFLCILCCQFLRICFDLFFFFLCLLCCQFLWMCFWFVFLLLVYPMLPVSPDVFLFCFSSSCVSYAASFSGCVFVLFFFFLCLICCQFLRMWFCFVFLRLVSPMLPVSPDCSFLIAFFGIL